MFGNNVNPFLMSFLSLGQLSLPTWVNDLLQSPFFVQSSAYLPHVLLAIALGAGIGFERRHRHKIAGVRTHLLVCVSSCIITLMGVYMTQAAGMGDATRIAGQILPALGFIGMGVITRKGWTTSGVTTAATILFTAGIGIMIGYGFFAAAAVVSILTITAVQLSYWIFPSTEPNGHAVRIVCPREHFHEVRKMFGEDAKLDKMSKDAGNVEFRLHTLMTMEQIDDLMARAVHNEQIVTIELAEPNE